MYNLITEHEWSHSGIFPRVTLCDFSVRNLGSSNVPNTVQCILPINMLNEKVFIILWFWLSFVLTVTIFNSLRWFGWLFIRRNSARFIRKLLHLTQPYHYDKGHANRFVRDFLGADGCFFVRMVALNAGEVVASEVLQVLWREWSLEHTSKKMYDSLEDAKDDLNDSVTV